MEERILHIAYGAVWAGWWGLPRTYDLVFTDRRVAGVVTSNVPFITGGFSASRATEVVQRARTARETYDIQRLDQRPLQENGGFSAEYGRLENAKAPGLVFRSLRFKFEGKQFYFYVQGEDRDKIRLLLAGRVPGFGP